MESYYHLAQFYDLLMEDVDYNSWCSFIEEIFKQYNCKPCNILDTACGTGNITIPMASKGYKLWGVDISEEMLTAAEKKSREKKLNIKFLRQDMTELELNRSFDAVLCMCDGVNYIIEEEALEDYFSSVYDHLLADGVFVFDISSSYKLSQILSNNTLFQEKNEYCYVWENSYYEAEELLEMRLNFFIPEKGLYRRLEEFHTQKAYSVDALTEMLCQAGFANIKVFDDMKLSKPVVTSERIFIAAQKL